MAYYCKSLINDVKYLPNYRHKLATLILLEYVEKRQIFLVFGSIDHSTKFFILVSNQLIHSLIKQFGSFTDND